MEERIFKLMAYISLIALAVWIVASALGKRDELSKRPNPVGRAQSANGSVWARKSVPAASSQVAAAAIPTPGQ
jgi:hypothetical protein